LGGGRSSTMAKGRGQEQQSPTSGRTPFFILAFLLFVGLLALITRQHAPDAAPRRPPPIRTTMHGMGSKGSGTKIKATAKPLDAAEEKAVHDAKVTKVAATAKKSFGTLKADLEKCGCAFLSPCHPTTLALWQWW